MNEMIATLFLSRDVTHRAHLSTESYAEHMALGSFYEEIITLADSLAEAYQGYSGKKLGNIPYYSNPSTKDTVSTLKLLLKQVQTERKDIAPDYSPIQNIIDEVESLFNSTIYKLTFLK